jgi:hypothetical protein
MYEVGVPSDPEASFLLSRVGAGVSAIMVETPAKDDQQERRSRLFFSTKGAVSGASL